MRLLCVSAVVLALIVSAPIASRLNAQNQSKPTPQDEFVPIDQLPQEEELPAAPIVVAAYSVVWVAFLVYVISLVKRVRRVEADLVALERERR
jgi:CcmD family protein